MNKTDKTLTKLIKRQRKKLPNQQNQKLKGNITTDTRESRESLDHSSKNLYYTKLENLKEMEKFLDKSYMPELNQDQM